MKYRKFWAALVGGACTSGLGIFAPDTVVFQVLTIVAGVATAASVYALPNEPA